MALWMRPLMTFIKPENEQHKCEHTMHYRNEHYVLYIAEEEKLFID